MKKIIALALTLVTLGCVLVSCGTDPNAKSEGTMTHSEFAAAAIDSEVVIEAFVQGKQAWWEGNSGTGVATVYLQDGEGGYFAYELACPEADYEKLAIGTKVKITGYKAEWSGEVEIVDATFEILSGKYKAKAIDVTEYLGTDTLADYQNMKVAFKGMTVESAAIYKWDGSGSEGDDLYFNVSKDDAIYTFVVESYLCDKDSDVYKAVKGLKVGDTVDLEGFLYWYEGAQPHITKVTVK